MNLITFNLTVFIFLCNSDLDGIKITFVFLSRKAKVALNTF